MKAFLLDLARCNGCYCCQISCKDEHVVNDWMPYAKPQPDYGQFWMKIHEQERGSIPKIRVSYTPVLCSHCDDAKCMEVCKANAIYRREDGLIVIDPAKCTGCKLCPDFCPSHSIFFNEDLNLAQKCTGCAHLIDDGWEAPRCVDSCPTSALRFGDEEQFQEEIARAETPKEACGPGRVYYLNVPKKFVGGCVYDPVEKEVLIGAACTLNDADGKTVHTTVTDCYGDFWFRGLPDNHAYTLEIRKDSASLSIANISTAKDVNLSDLAMPQA